jgi:hypothetical protein
MRTRNLMAKVFCYRRELTWASQDKREPRISLTTVKTLRSELQHSNPIELQRAAHDLGINLVRLKLYEC